MTKRYSRLEATKRGCRETFGSFILRLLRSFILRLLVVIVEKFKTKAASPNTMLPKKVDSKNEPLGRSNLPRRAIEVVPDLSALFSP